MKTCQYFQLAAFVCYSFHSFDCFFWLRFSKTMFGFVLHITLFQIYDEMIHEIAQKEYQMKNKEIAHQHTTSVFCAQLVVIFTENRFLL